MATDPGEGLVRFLLARIDDDDQHLRRLRRSQVRGGTTGAEVEGVLSVERQRAECAAKRAVIAAAQRLLVLRDQPAEKTVRDAAVSILQALAAPYRDHAGFRAEWVGRRKR